MRAELSNWWTWNEEEKRDLMKNKTKGFCSWGKIVISTHRKVGPKPSWQFLLLIKVTYMKISFNLSFDDEHESWVSLYVNICVCASLSTAFFTCQMEFFFFQENFSFWVKSAMHFINESCTAENMIDIVRVWHYSDIAFLDVQTCNEVTIFHLNIIQLIYA